MTLIIPLTILAVSRPGAGRHQTRRSAQKQKGGLTAPLTNVGWKLEKQSKELQLDALPEPPAWSHAADHRDLRDLWAPEIVRLGARYVMYFVAERTPLLCTEFQEGLIDPSPFREGGELLLYYKVDGNCCGLRAGIYASRLAPDGLAVLGVPQAIGVVNDREWEGEIGEAPTMIEHGGRHVLFYSGEVFSHPSYGVGFAACTTALGPCTKATTQLLQGDGALKGPGHQSVFSVGNRDYIAYHALAPNTPLNDYAQRDLHIEPLRWNSGQPLIGLRLASH